MEIIPSAQTFAHSFDSRRRDEKKATHAQKLESSVSQFVDAVTKMLVDGIKETPTSKGKVEVNVRTSKLGVYGGIHGTVLLYGHHDRDAPFTVRKPLELEVSAFRRLQERFYNLPEGQGHWYLIEESDPDVNWDVIRFVLYSKRPGPNHYYFNQGRLWHGHDMFDLDAGEEYTPEDGLLSVKDDQGDETLAPEPTHRTPLFTSEVDRACEETDNVPSPPPVTPESEDKLNPDASPYVLGTEGEAW